MNKALVIFIVFGVILFLYFSKKGKLRYLLLSALSGFAAFFAVDWICSFFSSGLPVNLFTLSVSAAGGIPGVILLTLMQTFL